MVILGSFENLSQCHAFLWSANSVELNCTGVNKSHCTPCSEGHYADKGKHLMLYVINNSAKVEINTNYS